MNRKMKGFTLIELLIVIAVIAILATVVITNVAGARQKANDSKLLSDLSSATRAAVTCTTEDGTVSLTTDVAPVAAANICSSSAVSGVWPTVSGKSSDGGTWAYSATDTAVSGSTFTFVAKSTTNTITCKETGCTKNW